ncbi:MAG: 2-amino-4-hydroxy-6-hydroxymethyldihydropteridine diphosphokinase [Phycisphaeraceae bacterium]|nr:2-amino-4-hydroxy-6-hydroxymethyldihydropteridine diphosphokinase [Phycisphaeraceae bacterium]
MNSRKLERTWIGLGSNLGDRSAQLRQAVRSLKALPGVEAVAVSALYETEPVGPIQQGLFLNAAARLLARMEPPSLIRSLQEIERRAGRDEPAARPHWGPRSLDLDILLWEEQVIDLPGIRVPHPRMHERAFVLKPLADLDPDAVHPVLGETIARLLEQADTTGVNRIAGDDWA